MKRRDFLATASSAMLPVLLSGFKVRSLDSRSSIVDALRHTSALSDDKILVIIYLAGGNDGLNTVIPLSYYDKYIQLRENIAIPETQVLRLNGINEMGFHPVMTGMKRMYDEGKLAVVHSVSYPNPNLSHYRSTDIWMTGVDSSQYSSTGWAGRYLNDRFQGYPTGYPNAQMEDPLAIQIGQISTPTLLGSEQSMGVTLQDPTTFYQLIGEPNTSVQGSLPCCEAGELISYIRQKQTSAVGYGAEIKSAADAGRNLATYPDSSQKNELAEQLKIVARLIHGGLRSKIYYVELGGFDTHSGQVETSTTQGVHATLLKKLSDAISAFQQDLRLQGTEDRVLGLTFSDFGRRASSNASMGTDHGIGAPMFVFGSGIKRQQIGTVPNLISGLVNSSQTGGVSNLDIKMQIDFRRVYGDVLNGWFGNASAKTEQILFKKFDTTSIFSDVVESRTSGMWANPEIWSSGRVPSLKDVVRINAGHLVTAAENIVAKELKVLSGGELRFLGNYRVNLIQ